MANGLTVDALDMHDSGHEAKGHAGAAVVPCALVLAKALPGLNLGDERLQARFSSHPDFLRALTGREMVEMLVVKQTLFKSINCQSVLYHSHAAISVSI